MVASLTAAETRNGKDNWESLKTLAPGDRIRIVLNDAKAYTGQLQTLSDDTIAARLATGDQTFSRDSVLRVSAKGQSHRARNALLGLAAGVGTGVIVAVASPELGTGTCAQGSCINATSMSLAASVGAVIGVGIGTALPTGGWYDLYRAR